MLRGEPSARPAHAIQELGVDMACVGSCSKEFEGSFHIGQLCKLEGCGRQVYRDARGRSKDFCGRTHAEECIKRQHIAAFRDEQRLPCLVFYCAAPQAVKEGGGFHPFCSWRHAKEQAASVALAKVLDKELHDPVRIPDELNEVQPRAEAHMHDQPAVAQTSDSHQLFVQRIQNQSIVHNLWTRILAAWPHDGFHQDQFSTITYLKDGIKQLHPWELIQAHVETGPRFFLSIRKNTGHKGRIERMTKGGLSWRQSGKPVSDHQNVVIKQSFSYRATEGKKTKDLALVRIFTSKETLSGQESPSKALGLGQNKKRKREVNFRYLMTEYSLITRPGDLLKEADKCSASAGSSMGFPIIHALRQNCSGFPDWPPRNPDAPGAGHHSCKLNYKRALLDEKSATECGACAATSATTMFFTADLRGHELNATAREGPERGDSGASSRSISVGQADQCTDASVQLGSSMRRMFRPQGEGSCANLSAGNGLASDLSDWDFLVDPDIDIDAYGELEGETTFLGAMEGVANSPHS